MLGETAHLCCTLCRLLQLDRWDWNHVKAAKLTYLAGDAEKTQTAIGWHNRDPLGISFHPYVPSLHRLQHGGFGVARLLTSLFWAPELHVARESEPG